MSHVSQGPACRQRGGTFGPWCALALLSHLAGITSASAAPIDLRIHWIEPAWVSNTTGGTVEVSGLGFDSTITAAIDGVQLPAASVQVLSPTRLRLILPAAPAPKISTLTLRRTLDAVNIQTASKPGGIFYTGPIPDLPRAEIFYVRPAPGGSDSNPGTSPTAPKATINAAIDAAMGTNNSLPLAPAQIRAAAGTYSENVQMPRGAVLLGGWSTDFTQRDPDRFVSIIDGRRNNLSAARTAGATENFCLLDGFTLTNSRRTGAGAAFRSFLGGPTLSNNVIIGNIASKRGAGIYFRFGETFDASATIAKNLIVGNRAQELSGGGVLLYAYYYTNQGDINVAVTDNLIVGNRAVLHGGGVAVGNSVYYTQDRLNVSLSHNRIQFNQSENGGALAVYPSLHTQFSVRAHNNLMAQNQALAQGGAVFFAGAGGGDLQVTSSTLVSNTAAAGGALYRAVPLRTSSQFTALIDDILWSNTGGDVGDPEGSVVIHYTLSNDDFSLRGAGNFSSDPRFTPGPLGLYYLDPTSPAIDNGSDLASLRGLSERTTLVSQSLDAGRLDLGVHYPVTSIAGATTPQFLHLVPAFGNFLGGDWVLARGSDFRPGARLTFDGADAVRTLFVAGNRLLAEPPPRALQGTYTLVNVQVINPGSAASTQTLQYRYLDADIPEWDSTLGVISADSPQESGPAVIVRWNPALDAVSPPIRYNVHREPNSGTGSQLIIPQASNLIASGLSGTSYVDRAFSNPDVGDSFVYRVRALDSAFLPNEEMNLTRVFGTVLTGSNAARPDPAVYLLGPREATSGDVVTLEVLVSNQGSATAASLGLDVSLPPEMLYVAGSTRRDTTIVIADDTSGTPFPLDLPGLTLSNVPHSTSTRITFQVRLSGAGGLLTWVGVVSSKSDPEVRSDNNRYERFINTKPLPGTDLSVLKTGPAAALSGSNITYTIRVTNNGTLTAQNVILTDTLPSSGLSYVNGSTRRDGAVVADNPSGTPFPLDGSGLALGSFGGADFTVIEFTATFTATSGSVVNQATATTTTTDLNTSNNTSSASTRVQIPDLAVTASSPATALQNSTFDLSVDVANAGDAAAEGVTLTDQISAALAYVAGTTRLDGTLIPDAATGTPFPLDEEGLPLGAMAPGSSHAIVFSVRATAGSGTATHTASATSTTPDSTPANNSATASTTLSFVDLGLTKSAPATAVAGAQIEYTLQLTNAGSAPGPDAVLSDILPAGATYVAGSTTRDGAAVADGAAGTPFPLDEAGLSLGTLDAGGTTQLRFRVTAPNQDATLVNNASAATSAPESRTDNNTGTASTTVRRPRADLALTIGDAPDPVTGGGGTLRYTLALRNDGDLAADGVLLTDTLPAGVTLLSSQPTPSSVSGSTLSFNLGSLAAADASPGGPDEEGITIDVRVDVFSGSLSNQAAASTTSFEEDLSDNSAQAVTTVQEPPLADLSVIKQAPATAAVGSRFSYTIDVSNTGTAPAASTRAVDTPPAGAVYVLGSTTRDGAALPDDPSDTPFPLDAAGFDLGTLPVSATTRLRFDVIAPSSAGTLTNTASASTSTLENDLADNQAGTTTQITPLADLALDKSGPATAARRGTVTYTLSVTNLGPSAAAAVILTDTLPSGSTYFTGTTTLNGIAVPDNTSGTAFPVDETGLNIGTLAAGATATAVFQVRAPNADAVSINRATVSSTTADPSSANNDDSITTFVGNAAAQADLVVTKTDGQDPVPGGSTLRYTLRVRNDGTLSAANVTLTDTLPAGVTFLSASPNPSSVSGSSVQFALGTLAATNGAPGGADEATLTLDVRVDLASGSLTNTASVATSSSEANAATNSTQTYTSVSLVSRSADLRVVKQAPATVAPGQSFVYTLQASNLGPDASPTTTLLDTLPSDVTYVAGSTRRDGAEVPDATSGTPFPLDGAGLALGSMEPGTSTSITFSVSAPASTGDLVNTATVATSASDPASANNSSQTTTRVVSTDLAVTASAPPQALQGSTFDLSASVANSGEVDAASVILTDTLPAELAYLPGTTRLNGAAVPDATSGTPFPLDEGGYSLGSLAPAAASSFTFSVRAVSGSGTATHTASATTTSLESSLANNSATASTTLSFVDLTLSKSAPAGALGGSTLQYSLRLANAGSAPAPDAILSDTLPAGAVYVPDSTRRDGTAVPDASSGTPFLLDEGGWGLGTLDPGAAADVVFSVTVPETAGDLVNTAAGVTSAPENDATNNQASASTRIQARADLGIQKSGPATAVRGSTFTYSLALNNAGPSASPLVRITDTLPAGVSYVQGSTLRDGAPVPDATSGTPFPLDEGGLNVADLAAGASTRVDFSVSLTAEGGSVTNEAAASSPDTFDPEPANNASQLTTQALSADLVVTAAAPTSGLQGDTFDLTLGVVNNGEASAESVTLTDALPAELAYVPGTTRIDGAAAPDGAIGTPFPLDEGGLALGSLPPAAARSVAFRVRAVAGSGSATHTGSATTTTPEASLANNSASASTNLSFVDLALLKSGPAAVLAGASFEYSLRLTNAGSAAAPDVVLSDTLPVGATYVAGSTRRDGAAVADGAAGTPFPLDEAGLALGELGAGGTVEAVFSVTAPESDASLVNTASTTTSAPESRSDNNSASATTTVRRPRADLALVMSDAPDPVTGGGGTLRYTLGLRNDGDLAADAVTLTDTLPTGVTLLSSQPAPSSASGSTLVFSLGSLAASDASSGGPDEATITIDVRVDVFSGSLDSQAAVSTTSFEDDLADNSAQAVTTVQEPPLADLTLSKQAPATVPVGGRFTYTLDVSNTGTAPSATTRIADTLPAGVAYAPGSATRDGTALPDDSSGTPFPIDGAGLDLGTLAPGATTRVRFDAVAPSSPASLTNTASASTTSLEADLSDNQSSVTTQVTPLADLALDKSGPVSVAKRATVTYTLTVTNSGPSAAAPVVVTDTLPSGSTYFAGTTTLNGAPVADPGSGTAFPLDESGLTISSLAAGASATIAFQVRAPNATVAAINQAAASSPTADPNSADNTDSVVTFVGGPTAQADLTVRKTDGQDPVPSGATLRYTLKVANDGTLAAGGVTLTDTLPAGVTYLSATPAPSSVSGGTVQFALGTLAASNSAPGGADEITVTLDVTIDLASGSLLNQASVSTTASEANPATNSTRTYTSVFQQTSTADVELVKQAPASVAAGQTFAYTLSVSNLGPDVSTATRLIDTLPVDATYVAGTTRRDGASVPDATSGTPFPLDEGGLTLGNLASGGSTEITFSARAPEASTTLINSASVSTGSIDPDTANNSSQASTTVAVADLAVIAAAPSEALQEAVFELAAGVTNAGEAEAVSVTLSDALPAELSYVPGTTRLDGAAVPDGASGTPFPLDEGGLPLGSLAPAAARNVTFNVRAAAGSGTATHTASATTSTPESTLSNNTASATTALAFVDLALAKTAPAEAPAGSTIEYSLRATNLGSAPAPAVVLSDTLPAGVSYVLGSTRRDGAGVADGTTGTPFPLDEAGLGLGSLATGGSSEVLFSVTLPLAAGAVTNTASASTGAPDIRSDNNAASATTTVSLSEADVSIGKTALAGVISGRELTYTIEVRVAATSGTPARGVTLLDALPSGATYVAGSARRDGAPIADDAAGTPFPLDGPGLLLGDMAAGALTSVQFAARVDLESGTLVNQASSGSVSTDPDASNNSAQISTQVSPAGTPLGRVGNTLDWESSTGSLAWSAAPGAAVYFVQRADTPAAYASGSAERLTPLGITETRWDGSADPAPRTVHFYRVNAGDGQAETDELHMADLSGSKSAPAAATGGDTVTYVIEVRNVGAREAADCRLTDALPPEAAYVAGSTRRDGQAIADDSSGSAFPLDEAGLDLGVRLPVSLTTISFQASLSGGGATVTNRALVYSTTPEHTESNNSSEAATALSAPPQADLNLSKTDGPDPITGGGSTLSYFLTVRNDGNLAAENVEIVDTLPAGVTFISASQPPSSVSGSTLRFALGTLAASDGLAGGNDEAALNLSVRVDLLSGTITNQASASTTTLEEDLSDNSTSTSTTVQEPPLADLVLVKQAPASVAPGALFTYELRVSNTGTASAEGARLHDTLPAGATYVATSTTLDGAAVPDDGSGTPFPLDEGGLDAGTVGLAFPKVVRFDVTAPSAAGTLTNSASVSTSTLETDLTDNQASAVTQVQQTTQADLSLDKSGPASVARRDFVSYTLVITNAGPSQATSAVVTDSLPPGVTYTAGSTRLNGAVVPDSTTGSAFPIDGTGLNIGNLASGAGATITFEVRMPNAAGVVVNQASVSSLTADPNTANNTDSVNTSVQ